MSVNKLRAIAEQLLDILKVEKTEKVVDGVTSVLEGVKEGVNISWENHILDHTNKALAHWCWKCEVCQTPIQVVRYKATALVYTDKEN